MVEVDLFKESDWVSFDVPQNGDDLIDFSGENVLSASVVHFVDEVFDLLPFDGAIFIVVQVIKKHADLMSGDLRIDLPKESLENIEINL